MSELFTIDFGFWNLWIGTILAWLSVIYLAILNKQALKRLWDVSWYPQEDKLILNLSFIINIVLVVVSIFIPIKTGTFWFYLGLAIYGSAFAANLFALHDYGTTPPDQAITKGFYSVSRNPLYVVWALMLLGLFIASTSVIFFILWIINNVITHWLILCEERYCLKKYGDDYRDYLNSVPRYFLFF